MKANIKKGFTLVELLVVITILAIISVVAYVSFGGVIGKANSARKQQDVTSLQNALQNYKIENNYYPKVDEYADTNAWGYNASATAQISNTFKVTPDGSEIGSVSDIAGGGKIIGKGDWNDRQIGAKGTISQQTVGVKNLSEDLYDPEIGDLKIKSGGKMIDKGIGRYVYATYRKPLDTGNWSENLNGTYFNLAYTVKVDGEDTYVTKIVGDFDSNACGITANCPNTLIGSGDSFLENGSKQKSYTTTDTNQGIPYPASF